MWLLYRKLHRKSKQNLYIQLEMDNTSFSLLHWTYTITHILQVWEGNHAKMITVSNVSNKSVLDLVSCSKYQELNVHIRIFSNLYVPFLNRMNWIPNTLRNIKYNSSVIENNTPVTQCTSWHRREEKTLKKMKRNWCAAIDIEGLTTEFQVFIVWYGVEWAFWW